MKTRTRIGLMLMAFWVTAWSASTAAAAIRFIDVAGPAPINADTTDSIVIRASDVVLDCGGKAIVGPAFLHDKPGRGITATNVNNVTIRNCKVNNWNVGISIAGGKGHRLQGVSLKGNWYGLALANTTGASIESLGGNAAVFESNVIGIDLARATNVRIDDALIAGNYRIGMKTSNGADNLEVVNSIFAYNGEVIDQRDAEGIYAGIYVGWSTKRLTITATYFESNGPLTTCAHKCHVSHTCPIPAQYQSSLILTLPAADWFFPGPNDA